MSTRIDIQLIEAQRERATIAMERAQCKLDRLPATTPKVGSTLLAKAHKTPRMTKRLRLIHQAVDAFVADPAAVSACRRGCSHCCRLPSIPITSAEARLLAQRTGRTVQEPTYRMAIRDLIAGQEQVFAADGEARYAGTACPFLVNDACSVYEDRPTVCRTHMNMDDDPLLCEVVPGHPANVPYLNTIPLQAQVMMLQQDECLGDIRGFFHPSPDATTRNDTGTVSPFS